MVGGENFVTIVMIMNNMVLSIGENFDTSCLTWTLNNMVVVIGGW